MFFIKTYTHKIWFSAVLMLSVSQFACGAETVLPASPNQKVSVLYKGLQEDFAALTRNKLTYDNMLRKKHRTMKDVKESGVVEERIKKVEKDIVNRLQELFTSLPDPSIVRRKALISFEKLANADRLMGFLSHTQNGKKNKDYLYNAFNELIKFQRDEELLYNFEGLDRPLYESAEVEDLVKAVNELSSALDGVPDLIGKFRTKLFFFPTNPLQQIEYIKAKNFGSRCEFEVLVLLNTYAKEKTPKTYSSSLIYNVLTQRVKDDGVQFNTRVVPLDEINLFDGIPVDVRDIEQAQGAVDFIDKFCLRNVPLLMQQIRKTAGSALADSAKKSLLIAYRDLLRINDLLFKAKIDEKTFNVINILDTKIKSMATDESYPFGMETHEAKLSEDYTIPIDRSMTSVDYDPVNNPKLYDVSLILETTVDSQPMTVENVQAPLTKEEQKQLSDEIRDLVVRGIDKRLSYTDKNRAAEILRTRAASLMDFQIGWLENITGLKAIIPVAPTTTKMPAPMVSTTTVSQPTAETTSDVEKLTRAIATRAAPGQLTPSEVTPAPTSDKDKSASLTITTEQKISPSSAEVVPTGKKREKEATGVGLRDRRTSARDYGYEADIDEPENTDNNFQNYESIKEEWKEKTPALPTSTASMAPVAPTPMPQPAPTGVWGVWNRFKTRVSNSVGSAFKAQPKKEAYAFDKERYKKSVYYNDKPYEEFARNMNKNKFVPVSQTEELKGFWGSLWARIFGS